MIVVLLALILFAILFPGLLRFMILSAIALVGVLFVMEVGHAQSLDLPAIDVESVCKTQLAEYASNPNTRVLVNSCINREQSFYDELKAMWPYVSDAAKRECSNIIGRQSGLRSKKYEIYSLCIQPRFEREQEVSAPPAHFQR